MSDIEIPPSLRGVAYLVGESWPRGSESGMFRIAGCYEVAAEELERLVPELNQVRGDLLAVLAGETAEVARRQFALLFDGEHSVRRLVEALRALAVSAR